MSRDLASQDSAARSWTLFLVAAGILLFGLVMLGSATAPIGMERFGSTYYFLSRQLLFGLLPGAILFYLFWHIPPHVWQKTWRIMLWISVALLLIVFIPGLGLRINNSLSWIHVGSFSLQPAELVKFTFIIFLSGWLAEHKKRLQKPFHEGLLHYLLYVGLVCGLLLVQPDVGTALVFFGVAGTMVFIAGAQVKHVAAIVGGALVVLLILIAIAPYRLERITVLFNPDKDPLGSGYHIKQAQIAVGSGGVLGLGLGNSRQKFQYLPEVSADSIFAVIAEEMGFIVSALLVVLYAVLALKAYQLSRVVDSDWSKYFVIGTATWISIQAFLNIGAMVGVLPLTGLPLPLISHGGTSLMVTLAAFGVMAAIAVPRLKWRDRATV